MDRGHPPNKMADRTVKNGPIEIQGDQRDRVINKMRELNYEVAG
jgi:translation initiation factor 1 (eIF-1/SUI1)